jgi:hypothetical protein
MSLSLPQPVLEGLLAPLLHLVPSKPLDPWNDQVRVVGNERGVSVEVATGTVFARIIHEAPGERELDDLFPLEQWFRMVKEIPSESETTLDASDRSKVSFTGGGYRFEFPLLDAEVKLPAPPYVGNEGLTQVSQAMPVSGLLAALARTEYALHDRAGVDTKLVNRVAILEGSSAVAYGGLVAQEAILHVSDNGGVHLPFTAPVYILDELIPAITKFLRPFAAEEFVARRLADESVGLWYVISTRRCVLAFPGPRFTEEPNVASVFTYADEQREESFRCRLDRRDLLSAARAAQIQGDPRRPILKFSFPGGDEDMLINVSTRSGVTGGMRLFERSLTAMVESDRAVNLYVGIDGLIEMLTASPDDTVDLYFYPQVRESGSSLMQHVSQDGCRALLPLVWDARF